MTTAWTESNICRSEVWAIRVPQGPVEAPITATGRPESASSREMRNAGSAAIESTSGFSPPASTASCAANDSRRIRSWSSAQICVLDCHTSSRMALRE